MEIKRGINLKMNPQELRTKQEGQLKDASKMYEQHFLNEMVKSMRKTIHREDGLLKPNMAENIFSEQLDQEYVKGWADKGGIGLADMIYKQMHEKIFPARKNFGKPNGPLPLDKSGPMQIKVEKQGNGGRVTFQSEGASAFQSSLPVQNPWSGRVALASHADGWSHLGLEHSNGLKSSLSFQGSLGSLAIGDELAAGAQVGSMPPGESSLLRWTIEEFA